MYSYVFLCFLCFLIYILMHSWTCVSHVFLCLLMYSYAFLCILIYSFVFFCILMYSYVFLSFLCLLMYSYVFLCVRMHSYLYIRIFISIYFIYIYIYCSDSGSHLIWHQTASASHSITQQSMASNGLSSEESTFVQPMPVPAFDPWPDEPPQGLAGPETRKANTSEIIV